ncbi:hypothetical protein [Planococcus koreensis]|uniref:hypothetical protein n=1 Tax=Planococcus koreensis TaxID=112331 RepID=UPI001081B78A|nr:hypothetical protein [Planococcus koreensis]
MKKTTKFIFASILVISSLPAISNLSENEAAQSRIPEPWSVGSEFAQSRIPEPWSVGTEVAQSPRTCR